MGNSPKGHSLVDPSKKTNVKPASNLIKNKEDANLRKALQVSAAEERKKQHELRGRPNAKLGQEMSSKKKEKNYQIVIDVANKKKQQYLDEMEKSSQLQYSCPYEKCDKVFSTADNLIQHQKTYDHFPTLTLSPSTPSNDNNNNNDNNIKDLVNNQQSEDNNFDSKLETCLTVLMNNPSEVLNDTLRTITSIFNNILTNPSEEKFRRIKFLSPIIQRTIVPISGALDLLLVCGFETKTLITDNKPETFLYLDQKHDLSSISIAMNLYSQYYQN